MPQTTNLLTPEQSSVLQITVTRACQFLGHNRQAWYQDNARRRKRQEHHAQVLDFVARVRCRQPRIPVVLLGRLAVDVCTQGHGFGKWLLSDAIHRVVNLAEQVGIKAVMVHAIDDDARAFYERLGFVQSVVAPNTLFYKV